MKEEKVLAHEFILTLLAGIIAGLGGCATSPSPVIDPNAKDEYGQTALYRAARYGDIDAVNRLLKAGANANERIGEDGLTSLYIASQNGYTQIVHALLMAKADVDAAWKGQTPLFVAAKKGHISIVRLLLENGADVNAVIESGVGVDLTRLTPEGKFPATVLTMTPLQAAKQNGHHDIVKLLRDHGGE